MINVACAIIVNEKAQILATQRSARMKLPLKWEFPGGKIENNETPQECLIREIKEELHLDIVVISALTPVEHHYEDFSIRLFPFECKIMAGEIKLTEHASFLWLHLNQLVDLAWAEADLPILKKIC